MDLFDIMTQGADPQDLALDRLQSIVALYDSLDDSVQDEALARAISLCGRQWGGYRQGLEALAGRLEARQSGSGTDPVTDAMAALRLREEAEDPGLLVRTARARRAEAARQDDARSALIARYGSLDAALAPTPVERMFIDAARGLAEDDHDDPWAPLAGWSLPWHPLPDALRRAVQEACPLPATVADARDEALTWEARLEELGVLSDGPGTAALPTACAARHLMVAELWRRALPVRNFPELQARLEYWAEKGGDDGAGYGIVLADLNVLADSGLPGPVREGTREKARRLKADNPGWSLARIGQELGISRQAVHKHLKGGPAP